MPSTRRSSLPPTDSPSTRSTRRQSAKPRASRDALTPVPITSPVASVAHLTIADEQMIDEARSIIGDSELEGRMSQTPLSARELRHAKLNEAREHHEEPGPEIGAIALNSGKQRGGRRSVSREVSRSPVKFTPIAHVSVNPEPSVESEAGPSTATLRSPAPLPVEQSAAALSSARVLDDTQNAEATSAFRSDSASASSSSSSSGSSSDSESDSDDSSETSTDSDEEDSDAEEERLDKLLQAARLSAQEKGKGKQVASTTNDMDDDVLRLKAEVDDVKHAPIPDIKVPALPAPYMTYHADGSARASSSKTLSRPSGLQKPKTVAELEVDDRPYEREPSKREKAAQPRKATVSEQWATLPAPRTDTLPQMKRDYQALALSNSLDPKRFMKGGTKLTKVPDLFAIGHVVDQPRHLQDTTLHRDIRYRPGSIVKDLIQDDTTGSYAKRKYGDLQQSRMDNGRGKGWKKRTKW